MLRLLLQRRLKRERVGYSVDDFVAAIAPAPASLEARVASAAYTYLQEWASVRDFPVKPDDDLYDLFGIAGEDIDDSLVEVARRCGETQLPWGIEIPPVVSARDLVSTCARLIAEEDKGIGPGPVSSS